MHKKPAVVLQDSLQPLLQPWTKHEFALLLSSSDLWHQHFHRPYDPAVGWKYLYVCSDEARKGKREPSCSVNSSYR